MKDLALDAIHIAEENVRNGGGPFGAVVIRNGEIIARGVNRVTSNHDPTAHAEVMAIREACQKLGTHQLDDCILITSCEPCPMCFGAIYWARLRKVYYAARQEDAAQAGFDDSFIFEQLTLPSSERKIPFVCMHHHEAIKPFVLWNRMEEKIKY